jgi:hypothetical protein
MSVHRAIARVLAPLCAFTLLMAFGGSASASEACPNEQLRAENSSTGLPDCRAYEMVSPVDKDGVNIGNLNTPTPNFQSTPDGNAIAYEAAGGFGDAPAGRQQSFYDGVRGAEGWSTHSLDPMKADYHSIESSAAQIAISSDLTEALVQTHAALTPDAVAGNLNLYMHDVSTGSYTLILTYSGNTGFGTIPAYVGGMSDLSKFVFQSPLALTPGAVAEAPNIYEYAGGHLTLLSILPDGTVAPTGGVSLSGGYLTTDEEVSNDASRVIFTSPAPFTSSTPAQVYMRVDGTHTVDVSASQRSTPDPAGEQSASFGGATADGSQVFFTSKEKLTDDSTASVSPEEADLYDYDLDTGVLTDVTPVPGADVVAVQGISGDGAYMYFTADGALTAGATAGASNLYVMHEGQIKFVAITGDLYGRGNYAISPSGRYLEMLTSAQLTGFESAGMAEIYVYDAQAGTLSCASCDPAGQPPTESVGLADGAGGLLSNHYARTMLDNGRAFFETSQALVPTDTNGQKDVYEWEDGHALLISSGLGATPSLLEEVSASGDDVFFDTGDQLVPRDKDALVDLYDARVGGGFTGPPSESVCVGTGCQGVPPTPPIFATPPSATYNGVGNFAAPVAAKPRAKPLTKAQKLTKALKACRAKQSRPMRAKCEAQARRTFGQKAKKTKKAKKAKQTNRRGN